MKEIKLTQDKVTIVNDELYAELNHVKYYAKITHLKKCINISYYNTEAESIKAYNGMATKSSLEFTNLNLK